MNVVKELVHNGLTLRKSVATKPAHHHQHHHENNDGMVEMKDRRHGKSQSNGESETKLTTPLTSNDMKCKDNKLSSSNKCTSAASVSHKSNHDYKEDSDDFLYVDIHDDDDEPSENPDIPRYASSSVTQSVSERPMKDSSARIPQVARLALSIVIC
jgi:hypothetical protein